MTIRVYPTTRMQKGEEMNEKLKPSHPRDDELNIFRSDAIQNDTKATFLLLKQLSVLSESDQIAATRSIFRELIYCCEQYLTNRMEELRYLSHLRSIQHSSEVNLLNISSLTNNLSLAMPDSLKDNHQNLENPSDNFETISQAIHSISEWLNTISRSQKNKSEYSNSSNTSQKQEHSKNIDATELRSVASDFTNRDSTINETHPPALEIQLLGSFDIKFKEKSFKKWPKGKGKVRQILKYIAYHNKPVPKEVLMDVFWPLHSPESARNNLNVTIYALRHMFIDNHISKSLINYSNGCYELSDEIVVVVDALRFEQLIKSSKKKFARHITSEAINDLNDALKLYSGEFVQDDPYMEWADPIREHLREQFIWALEKQTGFYYENNELDNAILSAQKVLEVDSCNELAHQYLMRSYNSKGQRYLALKQYDICNRELDAHLSASPSKETNELYLECQNRNNVSDNENPLSPNRHIFT